MVSSLYRGRPICAVECFYSFADGREQLVERSHNTLTYEGYDALAQLLSGNLSGWVNAFYYKFDSSGVAGTESPAGEDTNVAEFQALTNPWDYVRARLTVGALTSTNSALYTGNRATLVPIASTGTVGSLNGLIMGVGSVVTKAALVVAPDWSDPTQDLVYAAWAPVIPISPPVNAAVGLRWNIGFAFI